MPVNTIRVTGPARLHLGFLDLNGRLGRRFGCIGLALGEIATELSAARIDAGVEVSGPDAERARSFAARFMESEGLQGGVRLHVRRAIPAHAGLGSGTQMALAVGTAISRLYGLSRRVEEIAEALGRGRRSGIGIGAFLHGGFIMDGGRGGRTVTPPILSRMPVPEAWRFLLVLGRAADCGVCGEREDEAFARLREMAAASAGEICRLALMQVLPALAESDCRAFGSAIRRIQELMGRHFARVQCGPVANPRVREALDFLSRHGAAGVGQSSWGPTGFAIFPSEVEAFQAARNARAHWNDMQSLDFVSCRPRNAPAEILAGEAPAKNVRRR